MFLNLHCKHDQVLAVALTCPGAAACDKVEMMPCAGAEYGLDDIPRGRVGGIVLNAVQYEFKLLAHLGKHIDLSLGARLL